VAKSGPFLTLALGLASVAGSSCSAGFRCPAAGGTPWRSLASEHFALATDLPGEDAREALRDLEDYRAAFLDTAWPRGRAVGGQVRVVIMASERDWMEFDDVHDGFYTEALFQPLIALRAGGSDETRRRIRHELTHHLSRFHVRHQPDWLSEGLATFFETLVYDRVRAEVLIGLPVPAHVVSLMAHAGPLPVAATLSGALERQDGQKFYASSWLLVHYLINRRREAFGGYMRALDRGEAAGAAWQAAFPELTTDVLQAELRGHLQGRRALAGSRRFQAPRFTVEEDPAPLADPQVHALRALVAMRGAIKDVRPAARALARAEVAEALRQDAGNVLALAVRGFALQEPVDLAAARAAAARQPGSWLAWMVLYQAAGGNLDSVEGRKGAVTALRVAAANPSVDLPFGKARELIASPSSNASACQRRAPVAACAGGRNELTDDDVRADLKAIAESNAAWCLFDHATWPRVQVAVEIDERGRAVSVCAQGGPDDPRVAPCVERALAALSFAAPARCPRARTFELGAAPDGRAQVFTSR
jgi:hypothetical protein